MVRPTDLCWEHAKKLENDRFSCNYCHGKFPGGASRVKKHLSGRKGNDIKVCKEVPLDVQLNVRKALDTPKKLKDKQIEDENCSVPSSSGGPNQYMEVDNVLMGRNDNNNLLELNRALNSGNEKDRCQLLDKQLAKWLSLSGIDPEAIVSPFFENFVKSIVECGASYQLPSPFTLEKKLMLDVKSEASEYVKSFINDPENTGCTLMVNIWEKDDEGHLDIFAYSQRGAACLKSIKRSLYNGFEQEQEPIRSKPNKKKLTCSTIVELLDDIHFVQFVQVLANEAFFDTGVASHIKNNYPHICLSRCAAEYIDYCLLKMSGTLHLVIQHVSLIFYACHYYNVSSKRGTERPKGRYAFITFMLESVLEVKHKLQFVPLCRRILSSDRVNSIDEQEAAKHFRCAKMIDYIVGRKEFWSRVEAVAQVWFLLFQTRCLVNHHDSNIGYLYQMIERLKYGIEKSREYDHFIYDCTWKSFCEMRTKIIHPVHAAAAFLDPAYMYNDNIKENDEMTNGIKYILENAVDSDEKEAFKKELDQYRKKLSELFTTQARTMLKTWNPRIWWNSEFCRNHTPVLRKYAIRILSQPCNILFCKRYEVQRGDWRGDRSTNVNAMIINSKSLELVPIILDKLVEDHDAFEDVTELDQDGYKNIISQLTDDSVVNCLIDDLSLSIWDNPLFIIIHNFLFG